jgi:S-adenosylmethionine:tRNA ribosyltransferase-isomerase
LDRKNSKVEHKHFYDIVDYLKKGDILVFNNSKVFKARIFGKKETGGKIEFLLVRPIDDFVWEVLAKGKLKMGDKVFFEDKVVAEILEKNERALRVKFNISAEKFFKYLEKRGEMPLPPYVNIRTENNPEVRPPGVPRGRTSGLFYQTVYADKIGSVAAPTAGFHFIKELLDKLKKKGVEILYITLHVGPGTFLPVETENIEEHKMHEEFFEVRKDVWKKIVGARFIAPKKRIIAVGTTTCRVLEHLGAINRAPIDKDIFGSTDIFIYPPYDFKIVDALITNFHLPKSTLLMLVSAFVDPKDLKGIEKIKKAYKKAVDKKYRFYSFGDAMLIR